MKINSTQTPLLEWSGDAIALGFFETDEILTLKGEMIQLNDRLSGTIEELIAETECKGKSCCTCVTRVGGNNPIRKIIIVGLGKQEDFNLDTLRKIGANLARIAKKEKIKTLGLSLPFVENNQMESAQAIAEGLILALHQDNRFKSEPEKNDLKLEIVELIGFCAIEKAIIQAQQICSGVILARELVNAPPNVVTSLTMAQTAQELAKDYGLTLEILEREDCEKLGMGSFLGVAKASDLPPKFIHLIYYPPTTPRRKLGIIGKGLTFDSGGLNLKVSGSGIENMKMDMGGSAATLGAAKAIAQIKPDVEVHFITAVTENMISGGALRPGDILTASNGKTIEVNNTDAEGRLTLADALVYGEKLELDAIVDLATLTGACVVALGDDIAGLWSNNQDLVQELKQASAKSGEPLWEMPLQDSYFEIMKSPIADMKNTGSRSGGAITAALFLKQFIEKTPWAHLDIAGPVWADKESGINNQGATGFPVRTLVNWVCHFSNQ
jgi:leucyl aminopeptidase